MAWVERGGQNVTFDVMMMSIPDEQRDIVLEPIVLSDIEEEESFNKIAKDAGFLLPLKNWIQRKWNPPITEALPVAGYLPANKRNVVALLHLQAGKIVRVQFLNVPHDALFSRSLEELEPYLLGYCVSCQDSELSFFGINPSNNSPTINLGERSSWLSIRFPSSLSFVSRLKPLPDYLLFGCVADYEGFKSSGQCVRKVSSAAVVSTSSSE